MTPGTGIADFIPSSTMCASSGFAEQAADDRVIGLLRNSGLLTCQYFRNPYTSSLQHGLQPSCLPNAVSSDVTHG